MRLDRRLTVAGLVAIALAVTLILIASGCATTEYQRTVNATYTIEQSADRIYMEVHKAYKRGDLTLEQKAEAERLYDEFFDAAKVMKSLLVVWNETGDKPPDIEGLRLVLLRFRGQLMMIRNLGDG